MSKRDYYLCDCCNEKCFYDADIPDRFEQAGKIKAICKQCAETHTISIDGKAVAANIDRFGWGEMVKDSEGPYMLFSDHQQALAENVALYAKQVGEALERLTDDFIFRLAEKDQEIDCLSEQVNILNKKCLKDDRELQQIREHEFHRGYQEAEEKYQQILEKSVKLAEAFEIIANDNGLTCIEVQQFLNSPEVQAWKERQP